MSRFVRYRPLSVISTRMEVLMMSTVTRNTFVCSSSFASMRSRPMSAVYRSTKSSTQVLSSVDSCASLNGCVDACRFVCLDLLC